MSRSSAQLAAVLVGLVPFVAACHHDPPSEAPADPRSRLTPPSPHAMVPAVAVVGVAEWEACAAATNPVLDIGIDHDFYCEGQSLEGGAPLRYRNLPAIAADGSALAVVEERDGWGHVRQGIRILDRRGKSIAWYPLGGTGAEVEAAVATVNAALRARSWIPLHRPAVALSSVEDRSVTTFSLGRFTVVYEQQSDGNVWLPPSRIAVRDAKGNDVLSRTDTERAWSSPPVCNAPSFELVAASASPGVILFKTGLGTGGHNCDGVEQPPTWHVLAFPAS